MTRNASGTPGTPVAANIATTPADNTVSGELAPIANTNRAARPKVLRASVARLIFPIAPVSQFGATDDAPHPQRPTFRGITRRSRPPNGSDAWNGVRGHHGDGRLSRRRKDRD